MLCVFITNEPGSSVCRLVKSLDVNNVYSVAIIAVKSGGSISDAGVRPGGCICCGVVPSMMEPSPGCECIVLAV